MSMWILLVWIGVERSQAIAIDHFDTLEQCNAARIAIKQEMEQEAFVSSRDWFRCIPVGDMIKEVKP